MWGDVLPFVCVLSFCGQEYEANDEVRSCVVLRAMRGKEELHRKRTIARNLDRLVEDAANHDFITQTPMWEVSSVAPVSTPINSTPMKKQRVELAASKLFTADPNAQLLAQKKRDDLMASIDKKH